MNTNKKIQYFLGILLLVAFTVIAIIYSKVNYKLGLYLITGIAIGYVMQRSRLGFAGIIKKLYKMGNGELTRAIMFLLFISALPVISMQYLAAQHGEIGAGMSSVKTISMITLIGGFIFGVGMIFAGGCASGTLNDMGDGHIRSWIALPFFALGSLLGVWHLDFLHKTILSKGFKFYFPDHFGYLGSIAIFATIYILIHLGIKAYEIHRKKLGTFIPETWDEENKPLKDNTDGFFSFATFHKLFKEQWSFYTGGVLLSIIFITITITTGKNWGITSTFIYWGAWMLEPFGIDSSSIGYFTEHAKHLKALQGGFLTHPASFRNVGLFVGALAFALTSWGFNIKSDWRFKQILSFAIGGVFMGYGARLGSGCNIGAFYSALSSFSLSGFVFGIALFFGGYVGLKISDKLNLVQS